MNLYDTEFFKNWQNLGNTNEGITSQGIPDFQNYYNMNLGNQPFPHTGMQLPDVQPPGIEQSNVAQTQKKGFNFPGILGMMQSMFQRPEAKQKEFEAYEASMNPQGWGDFGDYKGNIWEGSGGNKINVVDPVTGVTVLQNKNFDSMFGSESVEEMIAKKEAWARKRRAKGEEYLSEELNNWLNELDKQKGGADGPPKEPSGYRRGDNTINWNPNITGTKSFHPSQGNVTPSLSPNPHQNPAPHGTNTSGSFAGKGSGNPWGRAQGGYMRSGYNRGGRVGILAAF